MLPAELLDIAMLHTLATNPSKVVPPGKSILSIMSSRASGPKKESPQTVLTDRVTSIVVTNFWTEAHEALSSTSPTIQLPRIRLLYMDLLPVLNPLLPATHPVLRTLASPLAPTSAPLLSTKESLLIILDALRQRCAPARDEQVDALRIKLGENGPHLAQVIVDTIRSIIDLAREMKEDLSTFTMGALGETQLRKVLKVEARKREREVVEKVWAADAIKDAWVAWNPSGPWKHRLLQALASKDAVSCVLPSLSIEAPPNGLPPILFFSIPDLLHIQNLLQALVVAASLRSLTRAPSADFVSRIWTLLHAEVEEEEGSGDTKLVNLADEVLRASPGSLEPDIRAAVERTLRTTDPVFMLLQKRLMSALETRLDESPFRETRMPTMKTGADREVKQSRLDLGLKDESWDEEVSAEPPLVVKGFEDAGLKDGIGETLKLIRQAVRWVESVWPAEYLS